MNVPSIIIDWIQSFLTGRKQRVKLIEQLFVGSAQCKWRSDKRPIWPDRWKYVDDCTVTKSILPHCNSNLQDLVDYIYNWTIANNMKLNVDKCKEMVTDFFKEKRNFTPLLINDVPVKRA